MNVVLFMEFEGVTTQVTPEQVLRLRELGLAEEGFLDGYVVLKADADVDAVNAVLLDQ